jgi:hypothetical protein
MLSLTERFWRKVRKTKNCWVWTGKTVAKRRYGIIRNNKCFQYAHRVAYELLVGPIPEDLCVLHRCDNQVCVNPFHLFLGTQFDNMVDCRVKGRNTRKLTPSQVREIRKRYRKGKPGCTTRALGRHYRVTASTIWYVINGQTWRDVS